MMAIEPRRGRSARETTTRMLTTGGILHLRHRRRCSITHQFQHRDPLTDRGCITTSAPRQHCMALNLMPTETSIAVTLALCLSLALCL